MDTTRWLVRRAEQRLKAAEMPSETNKVKPRGQGERPPEALGVGEPGARPGPSAGAGQAPALTLICCGVGQCADDQHDFKGWREFDDGRGGETVCTKCGMGAMAWSLRTGL